MVKKTTTPAPGFAPSFLPSFAGGDEGCELLVALLVAEALLVEGEVEGGEQRRDLVEVVLEGGAEPAFVRLGGEPAVEGELVGGAQRKPGALRVAVDLDAALRAPGGAAIVQIAARAPPLSGSPTVDSNAIRAPSGDHEGAPS